MKAQTHLEFEIHLTREHIHDLFRSTCQKNTKKETILKASKVSNSKINISE